MNRPDVIKTHPVDLSAEDFDEMMEKAFEEQEKRMKESEFYKALKDDKKEDDK